MTNYITINFNELYLYDIYIFDRCILSDGVLSKPNLLWANFVFGIDRYSVYTG